MHDTAPVHIPVAHLMSERNIDGDNGQGRTKDSRFGLYQSVVEFFAWFWATWQKAKGGTKEAYEFDDNICAFVHAQTEGLMRDNTFLPPINPIIWLVIVVFPSWD